MRFAFRLRRSALLCAAALTVWTGAPTARQTGTPAALPAALRAHVKSEQFQIVTSLRGLPLGVRDELQTLFGGSLDIAAPGAALARTEADDPKLARRRLVAAGCSMDHCLVHYERGGAAPAWLVALFHWTPDGTRLEWAGTASGSLATIDDVRSGVLSGAIKGPVKSW